MKTLKHPGNLIIIGFITMALALLTLVYMATQVKFDMAVEGDYYQQEVTFNEQLKAEKTANTLGKSFNFLSEGNKLSLNIPTQLSANITNGMVKFFCLSDSKFDTQQPLQKNVDGLYIFDRVTVAPGHNYIVKVSFTANGKDYYKEFKMQ